MSLFVALAVAITFLLLVTAAVSTVVNPLAIGKKSSDSGSDSKGSDSNSGTDSNNNDNNNGGSDNSGPAITPDESKDRINAKHLMVLPELPMWKLESPDV